MLFNCKLDVQMLLEKKQRRSPANCFACLLVLSTNFVSSLIIRLSLSMDLETDVTEEFNLCITICLNLHFLLALYRLIID